MAPQEPRGRQGLAGRVGPWLDQGLIQGRQVWADLMVALRRQFSWLVPWSEGAIAALLGGILVGLVGVALALGGRSSLEVPTTGDTLGISVGQEFPAGADPGPESAPGGTIAPLQGELTAIAQRYGDGFLQSVQANLAQSRLILVLSSNWYDLDGFAQGSLATDFQQRSQSLGFETLELRSLGGDLLARSPVVGTSMVILQSQAPPTLPPELPRYRLLLGDS